MTFLVTPSPESERYWLMLSWYFGDGKGDFGGGYFDGLLLAFKYDLKRHFEWYQRLGVRQEREASNRRKIEASRKAKAKRLGLKPTASYALIDEYLKAELEKAAKEIREQRHREKLEHARIKARYKGISTWPYEEQWHCKAPEDILMECEQNETVVWVLSTLRRKEQKIIRNIFGFNPRSMKNKELAATYGVSRGRIRQQQQRALRMLRHPSRAKHLKGFLG